MFLLVNHLTGLETFQWPEGDSLRVLLISCACDLVLNAAVCVGVVATSALFMLLGMLLVVPCGFLLELILGELITTNPLDITGIVLVSVGCLIFYTLDLAKSWCARRHSRGELTRAATTVPMTTLTKSDEKLVQGSITSTVDNEEIIDSEIDVL